MTFDDIVKRQLAAACPIYSDFKKTPKGNAVNFANVWEISRDPVLWQTLIGWCSQQIIDHNIQHIYAMEARGLHLAGAISTHTGVPFSPVRKVSKSKKSLHFYPSLLTLFAPF